MKKIKSILFVLLTSIVFSNIIFAGNVIIKGAILNGEGTSIYLQTFKNDKNIILDSTIIKKNGKFSFELNVESKNFYSLSLSGKSQKEIVLLILDQKKENSQITFKTNIETFSTAYTIKGNHECGVIKSYVEIINLFQQNRSIETDKFQNAVSENEKLLLKKSIDSIDLNFRVKRNKFIVENQLNLAVIITASSLNPQQDLDMYKKIRDGLLQSAPGSEYQIAFNEQVNQIELQLKEQKKQQEEKEAIKNLTNIGNLAPALNFNNPEGKLITLESLRGNYVLIDFWASWCKPCRMENPNVVKLYNKYKEQGFTVFSVSLDNNVEKWVNAIKKDGLTWPNHVSDLKQWRTEATKIYGFRGIPYTVLIDKEGKIIAKNLRGSSLETKLKEIFGN
jgi:thiol-disulfide isomerase/thioredoxin